MPNILTLGSLLSLLLVPALGRQRMVSKTDFFLPTDTETYPAGGRTTARYVTLADGTVLEGSERDGVVAFKGIPFAEAPVGTARWNPPVPWKNPDTTKVIDATKFGSSCVQGFSGGHSIGEEDCLFLNVWVPAEYFNGDDAAEYPVGVFVHGGSYNTGAGSMYSGEDMLKFWGGKGIIVTVNYRLNVFGFLGSEELRTLDGEAGSTGNYGIQDQRLAFRWVQDNIGSFGGNRDQVMIFGESAGAGSVTNHLAMKKSWGLYSSAALESGAFADWITQPMSCAQATYEALLHETGCSGLDCLMQLSTEAVFAASLNVDKPCPTYAYAWVPTADFIEIETHPWVSLANGDIADVPILHGTNADEGAAFCPLEKNATLEELHTFWSDFLQFSQDEISELEKLYLYQEYPEVDGCSQYWWAGQRSSGDLEFSCASKYGSQKLSTLDRRSSPVYMYHFEKARATPRFVTHFSEVPYVFHWQYAGFKDAADRDMSDVMTSYWGNFIIDPQHNPSSDLVGISGLPTWTPFIKGAERTILLPSKDAIVVAENGIKNDECAYLIPILDAGIRGMFEIKGQR